jgi:hypothetical protein
MIEDSFVIRRQPTTVVVGGPISTYAAYCGVASGATAMAGSIAVNRMGEEDACTQKSENRSYSLKHYRRPWPSSSAT